MFQSGPGEKSNSSCFWGTSCGLVVPLTPLEPPEDIHLYCALNSLGIDKESEDVLCKCTPQDVYFLTQEAPRNKE